MADASIRAAIAVGIPTLAVLVGTLINSRFSDPRGHMDARFAGMREMWQSDWRRVEEVIAARLKHLEAR